MSINNEGFNKVEDKSSEEKYDYKTGMLEMTPEERETEGKKGD